jgi:hypothetical protein
MTLTAAPPSTIQGDSYPDSFAGGVSLSFLMPWLLAYAGYTDLPPYWSYARDVALSATIHREDMWASAVGKVATKFAAHGYVIKDSQDSQRRVSASQELFKRINGGEGWVPTAEKLIQDWTTTDNGVFLRIRRADDTAVKVRLKAAKLPGGYAEQEFTEVVQGSGAGRITGLYHLDSLRCQRTGNLAYPVIYQPLYGAPQLLRWDQVLFNADMPSPRAGLLGVGLCAASRAYKTITTVAAGRQLFHEFITGGGANKLVLIGGLQEQTLRALLAAGVAENQAKGFVYYLGTILGAIPSDTPITVQEIILKSLPEGFDWKQYLDDAYVIYANAIGVPVQDIQPLSGQGLGTGTQTVILQEAARGVGIAAFLKWWEQTVSDRVLPATTELSFSNEYDLRDQEQKAKVTGMRASERATRIQSGEISPAIARQLAADSEDLPQDLIAVDVTPGGQLRDDQKPLDLADATPEARLLMSTAPTAAPQSPAMKSYDALWAAELRLARELARWAE